MIRSFYGKKTVNYLDAKSGKIKKGPNSNKFNAMVGWYSDEFEYGSRITASATFYRAQ